MPIRSSSPPPPAFPLYLFQSVPFRRRRSSTVSNSTASTTSPSSSPPTQPTSFLHSSTTSHLRCHKCLTDLIPISSIISKGFTGRHGRAYLVAPPSPSAIFGGAENGKGWNEGDLPNTLTHKSVPRQLVTGAHTVADISCRNCGSVLGWKYVEAEEESQRYKVGKFILETKRVVRGAGWEDMNEEDVADADRKDGPRDDVEFDSQDEDECEDLFSGIWSPQLAKRRRKNKSFGRDDD